MSDLNEEKQLTNLPSAILKDKHHWSLQFIWIIPILAVLVGISLVVKTIINTGPTITISFKSGDGLVAGKTIVSYKGVNVGLVKTVTLAEDGGYVIASVQMNKQKVDFLKDDTSFWLVQPRISAGGVSGLSTLLDGPYIAADIGKGTEKQTDFVALEVPPIVTGDMPGREFVLHSPTLGSLDVGSPVYFRRLSVGEVVAHNLDKDGKGVSIRVFVNAPYDKYVTTNTRFWNASGIDISLGAGGLQVQTESLLSILAGGIAFEAPQKTTYQSFDVRKTGDQASSTGKNEIVMPERAQADAQFPLFSSRTLAMQNQNAFFERYVINFKESVRGLAVGAPVEFRGIHIGEVASIETAINPKTYEVFQPVEIYLFPDRLQARSLSDGTLIKPSTNTEEGLKKIKAFLAHGLRAQLRSGSLLTGAKYVGIDFFPEAPKYTLNVSKTPWEIPAVPSSLDDIEKTLGQVIKNTDRVLTKLDEQVIPEFNQTLKNVNGMTASDSPLQTDLRDSLRSLTKAADSLKTLSDMLDQQPQSLLYGKPSQGAK
jgi:paraquat-inducible protein B